MSPRYEFQVLLHRIGRWWAVDIPGLDLHDRGHALNATAWHGSVSSEPRAENNKSRLTVPS